MVFVNISLLAGGVLVGLPILLHLLMRPRPKRHIFPAVRFIQQRKLANTRQLNLRHWLLLALRCGAIALAALALARPAVASLLWTNYFAWGLLTIALALVALLALVSFQRKLAGWVKASLTMLAVLLAGAWGVAGYRSLASDQSVMGNQEAPVAAVLVVDTSPRMQYRQDDLTRLDLAKQTAGWLMQQLPAESEVAVLDSRGAGGTFAVDRSAAEKSVERLRTTGTPRPLAEILPAALRLVTKSEKTRREIYLFTDLTKPAWKTDGADASALAKTLATERNVLIYVIDCGVSAPRNFSLGALEQSAQILPPSGELRLKTTLSAQGTSGERSVELWIEEPDPTLPIIRDGKPILPKKTKRGVQTLKLAAGDSQQVEFVVRGLTPGTNQGELRLVGEDGLAADDVKFFTAEVQAVWPVLVVAPENVPAELLYLPEAIAPKGFAESSFRCDVIGQGAFAATDLTPYRAIALIDPAPLLPENWEKIGGFAQRGGGVAIFLGHNAEMVASFQDPAAEKVLGGKLTRQTRTGGNVYFDPRNYDHPVLAKFRAEQDKVPWNRFPINYHWNLDELTANARMLIPYSSGKPALVETRLGQGHVLTLTTPISDPLYSPTRPSWNELPRGEDAWPCFYLVNDMLQYLARGGDTRLNFITGEAAVLDNDPVTYPERYQIFTPLEEPQDILARDGKLSIRFTENPGPYRLRGTFQPTGQAARPLARGFAVNLPADSGDLTRLPPDSLDQILGKNRYQFAKNREEINRAVGNQRVGAEFYPLLISLLALVMGLEHLLANLFYRKED